MMAGDSADQLADIWLPRETPTNDIQQLYLRLHELLDRLREGQKTPQILENPDLYNPELIYEEALRSVFSDAYADLGDDERTSLLNTLSDCLQRIKSDFSPKTAVTVTSPPNHFPARPKQARHLVESIQHACNAYLTGFGRKTQLSTLGESFQVGLLVTMVALRHGQCSLRVLTELAATLQAPLRIAGDWFYRDILSGPESRRPPESRRVFLDSVTAAIYMRLSPDCGIEFRNAPSNETPAQRSRRHKQLLRKCFNYFLSEIDLKGVSKQPTLNQFLKARSELLRMSACTVIADYATGELVSSSFRESAWLRWLKYLPPKQPEMSTRDGDSKDAGFSSIPNKTTSAASRLDESGEFDEDGIIADIRVILRQPHRTWTADLEKLLASLKPEKSQESAEVLLVGWVLRLVSQPRYSGKFAAASTVKYMFGLFASRFLSVCDPDGYRGQMSVDELHDCYLEILEQSVSAGHESRLAEVIYDFDRYYRTQIRPDLENERPDLPVAGGYYEISANALSPSEYMAVRREIEGLRTPFTTEKLQSQAKAVLAMAWRLGLRRSEMLGLERRDFHWDERLLLVIRNNAQRHLKTTNARRLVPMRMLAGEERHNVKQILDTPTDRRPDAAYFQDEQDSTKTLADHLIIPGLKRLLHRVSEDPGLHLHNLRHSAASWLFLALLADDVELSRYKKRAPFLTGVLRLKDNAEKELLNRFHPYGSRAYAISRLLGHGEPGTSFQHYIHSLDLLLYAVTDQSDQHGDQQIQLAAACHSSTRRLRTGSPSGMLRALEKKFPERIAHCEKKVTSQDGDDSISVTSNKTLRFEQLEHRWLERQFDLDGSSVDAKNKLERGISELDVPKPGAPRESVHYVLELLNTAINRNRDEAIVAIKLWATHRLWNEDWASLKAPQVTQFLNAIVVCEEQLGCFEAKSIHSNKLTKHNSRRTSGNSELVKLLHGQITKGRYWIRVKDARPGSIRRKLDSHERQRQRTQAAVTWSVMAAAVWL